MTTAEKKLNRDLRRHEQEAEKRLLEELGNQDFPVIEVPKEQKDKLAEQILVRNIRQYFVYSFKAVYNGMGKRPLPIRTAFELMNHFHGMKSYMVKDGLQLADVVLRFRDLNSHGFDMVSLFPKIAEEAADFAARRALVEAYAKELGLESVILV